MRTRIFDLKSKDELRESLEFILSKDSLSDNDWEIAQDIVYSLSPAIGIFPDRYFGGYSDKEKRAIRDSSVIQAYMRIFQENTTMYPTINMIYTVLVYKDFMTLVSKLALKNAVVSNPYIIPGDDEYPYIDVSDSSSKTLYDTGVWFYSMMAGAVDQDLFIGNAIVSTPVIIDILVEHSLPFVIDDFDDLDGYSILYDPSQSYLMDEINMREVFLTTVDLRVRGSKYTLSKNIPVPTGIMGEYTEEDLIESDYSIGTNKLYRSLFRIEGVK